MTIDPDKDYRAVIETNKGKITLELLPQHAPMTVNNFVFLANQGFYDDVLFHRVIGNFMIRGMMNQPTRAATASNRRPAADVRGVLSRRSTCCRTMRSSCSLALAKVGGSRLSASV